MKENKELERHDIAIDREMEVDCDIGQEITVYIETWFDVDKKFGTQLNGNDSAWLNLYGKYNPYTSGTVPEYDQQLLTLSTCYGSSKSGRLLVIAAAP